MTRSVDKRACAEHGGEYGAEYGAFLEASERLGRDPLQVQGPGGNTSIKDGGTMWVKASGTWLAEARTGDIMVRVDAAGMAAALAAEDPLARDPANFLEVHASPAGLRGSIETTMHAAIAWPVVLHTHCVATIAVAVRRDAEALVHSRLRGLDAVFVSYVRPGYDLAQAIRARAKPQTRVFVLGNHGLVVGGARVAETERLLREVSRRLEPDSPGRGTAPDPVFARRLEGSGWISAPDPVTHAIARDPARLAMAGGMTLYPDHLMFLGPGVAIARPGESPRQAVLRCAAGAGHRVAHRLVLFPGEGAAIPADATPAVRAMARCLGDVLARTDPAATIARLSEAQERALIDWAPEKHRQTLNAAGGATP